ncbi:hypothetical protein [Streptococcus merionis]|uniref:Phosphoribosylaminoimidazole carboxylase ATPase subunit n=1 Tax=Streptococcus merionis TaxID=400065 RepID=A0A239SYG8_9STRE|nr:hypothetical protein [Streptococcus merionis]SNU89908.1 phosphoribosylaminoimidazole carboxylase ATPase subunit [Streptococcus merionis]
MIQIIVHAFADTSEAVVQVVYASSDHLAVSKRYKALKEQLPNDYLAIYDLPLDTDLTQLRHFPSVAISPDDFTT